MDSGLKKYNVWIGGLVAVLVGFAFLSSCAVYKTDDVSELGIGPTLVVNAQEFEKSLWKNVNGYCDDPKDFYKEGIHSSFKPFQEIVLSLKANPRKLEPKECIAIAALAKSVDFVDEGRGCADRDVYSLSKWISYCGETAWNPDEEIISGECQLLGFEDQMGRRGSELMMKWLEGNVQDCMWNAEQRSQHLTQENLKAAVRLLLKQ